MNWADVKAFCESWYPPGSRVIIVPYAYNVTFTALALAVPQTQILNITANADFVHLQTAVRANVAGAAQTVSTVTAPLARLLITDSGTNEQFTAAPIDVFNYATKIAPNFEEGHVYPRVIGGRSSLNLTMTSYAAAELPAIDVALIGVLVRVLG
jgi:hypothetical protein